MNSIDWLASEGTPYEEGPTPTILQELAELIRLNGGMGWRGVGPLPPSAALRLLYLSGMLDGFTKAEDGANTEAVKKAIQDQIKADVEELRAAALVGPDGGEIDRKPPSLVSVDGQPINGRVPGEDH